MDQFFNILIGLLPQICAGLLAGFAVTLIFKTSYTTNFAQGVISAIGAYVAIQISDSTSLPMWATLLIGIVVSFGIGIVIDVVIFRNGRNVNVLGKQIITMGLISIFVGLIYFVFEIARVQVPSHPFIDTAEGFNIGTVRIPYNHLICLAITVVLLALVFILLHKSKWGLSVRATASNETVAGMMGINTKAITAISWGIAGALGAVAAVLYTTSKTFSHPYFMTDIQLNAFLAGILGGFATFYGPILGVLIIYMVTAIFQFIATYATALSSWRPAAVYLIVLLLVLWKPQGLFGKKTVKKV